MTYFCVCPLNTQLFEGMDHVSVIRADSPSNWVLVRVCWERLLKLAVPAKYPGEAWGSCPVKEKIELKIEPYTERERKDSEENSFIFRGDLSFSLIKLKQWL